MTKKNNAADAHSPKMLSARLHALRKNKIRDITDALISSGYTSLDEQAKALGLHRATVWTIRKNKHKLGRLSAKTIDRVIANPNTPPLVLSALQEYVRGKLGKCDDRDAAEVNVHRAISPTRRMVEG